MKSKSCRVTYLHNAERIRKDFQLFFGQISADSLLEQLISFFAQEGMYSKELPLELISIGDMRCKLFEQLLADYASQDRLSSQSIPTKSEAITRNLNVDLIRNLFWHYIEAKKLNLFLSDSYIANLRTSKKPKSQRGTKRNSSSLVPLVNHIVQVFLHNDGPGINKEAQYMTLELACERAATLIEILFGKSASPLSIKRNFRRTSHRSLGTESGVFVGFRKVKGKPTVIYSNSEVDLKKKSWRGKFDRSKTRQLTAK